jgi:hypothetical protein
MVGYLIEFVLVLFIIALASQFWSTIKSRSYIRSVLENRAELEKFVAVVGWYELQRDATELRPVCGSWLQNIDVNSKAHFSALATTRTMLLLSTAAIMVGSFYFLGAAYGAIDLIVFFLMAIPQLSAPAKNYNLGLVRTILLNLYRWSRDDSDEARRYCPKSLEIALATVSQLTERDEPRSEQYSGKMQ